MTKPTDPDARAQQVSAASRKKHADEIDRVADRNRKAHVAAKKIREKATAEKLRHLGPNSR